MLEEASPLYQAYVTSFAASDEGSTFSGQDQPVQVMDNSGGQGNQNISQQELEKEHPSQPVHHSMGMSHQSPAARWLRTRTHTLRACVRAPLFVRAPPPPTHHPLATPLCAGRCAFCCAGPQPAPAASRRAACRHCRARDAPRAPSRHQFSISFINLLEIFY